MFGPNARVDESNARYHHREHGFHVLLKELEATFVEIFGLEDYEVVFLTGNGSTANEAVVFSNRYAFDYLFDDMEFGERLRKQSTAHGRNLNKHPHSRCVAYPLYETSCSRFNCYNASNEFVFLDMVSAFPFYMPPKGTAVWTTVSSKQLGAYPVLGIVAMHKSVDWGEHLCNYDRSVLNLVDYLFYKQRYETPSTPAIALYRDLLWRLQGFDRDTLVKKIKQRRARVVNLVGDCVIGTGPVITFSMHADKKLLAVLDEFNLYVSREGRQMFLWSGEDADYERFYNALERTL